MFVLPAFCRGCVPPKSSVVPGTLDTVHTPTRLVDSGAGRWRVVTETSAHYLDLDSRTVTRIDGGGTPTTGAGYTVSALRRDRETLPLLEMVRCEVGHPMTLLIRVQDDRVTLRRTTSVITIAPAEVLTPHP